MLSRAFKPVRACSCNHQHQVAPFCKTPNGRAQQLQSQLAQLRAKLDAIEIKTHLDTDLYEDTIKSIHRVEDKLVEVLSDPLTNDYCIDSPDADECRFFDL